MDTKKILIVDDDNDLVEILTILLELGNYQIESIDKGENFMETVFRFKPDLIILDVVLGDSNGKDLCNKLKNATESRNIPVIMMSGNNKINSIYAYCEPDDFLAKPFEIKQLHEIIKAHLN